MISKYYLVPAVLALGAGSLIACASTEPAILKDARESYREAAKSEASTRARAHLDNAKQALIRAEQSFDEHGDSADTRDLAYIADRLAQVAEAQAMLGSAVADRDSAKHDLEV